MIVEWLSKNPKQQRRKRKEKAHCTWRRGVVPPIKEWMKYFSALELGRNTVYERAVQMWTLEKFWVFHQGVIHHPHSHRYKRHDLWGIEVKLSSKLPSGFTAFLVVSWILIAMTDIITSARTSPPPGSLSSTLFPWLMADVGARLYRLQHSPPASGTYTDGGTVCPLDWWLHHALELLKGEDCASWLQPVPSIWNSGGS